MRHTKILALLVLTSLPAASVLADSDFLRSLASSATTTGSSYLTSRDKKLTLATQDDASSFVASDGRIRGPYLEAAIEQARASHPELAASEMEIAQAILTKHLPAES